MRKTQVASPEAGPRGVERGGDRVGIDRGEATAQLALEQTDCPTWDIRHGLRLSTRDTVPARTQCDEHLTGSSAQFGGEAKKYRNTYSVIVVTLLSQFESGLLQARLAYKLLGRMSRRERQLTSKACVFSKSRGYKVCVTHRSMSDTYPGTSRMFAFSCARLSVNFQSGSLPGNRK